VSFALDEDQLQFRASVRQFLTAHSAEQDVRRLMASDRGYDPDVWSLIARQLELQGLGIPEKFGGSGFSSVEVGIAFEEMGRALLCAPYFSTAALAVPLLVHSGDDAACAEYLPEVAAGRLVVTVAIAEASGRWDADGVTTEARLGTGGGWRLSGEKSFVIDGHTADKVLVTARTTEGIGVFVIDGGAEGVSRSALKTLDQTRRLARVTLSESPGRLLASPADGWELAEHALRHGAACLAMESVGGAQRTLDMAVDYVRTREQFGRTIGSFQAIKHRCADLLVRVESAKSAAYHSIRASAEGAEDFVLVASLAKAYCTDVYFAAAVENIQLHGGIGFTWEHPAHLYFRRAKSSQLLLGDSSHHRAIVAYHSGI